MVVVVLVVVVVVVVVDAAVPFVSKGTLMTLP